MKHERLLFSAPVLLQLTCNGRCVVIREKGFTSHLQRAVAALSFHSPIVSLSYFSRFPGMKRSFEATAGGIATVTSGNGVAVNTNKPVFLTKSQREQLALQRREEQIAEQKRRAEQLLLQARSSASAETSTTINNKSHPSDSPPHHRSSFNRDRDRDRDPYRDRERERERDRDRDSERRNHREREREREEESKATRERARVEKLAEREKEKELDAIKEQYLGSKKPKKRVIKPSEKFRFSFDWENTEDTSRDMNALYQNPHEAQLLFGRGFRAGIDRREQKKLAVKNEVELREEVRRKEGFEEKPEDAAAQRRREQAAELYDTFDMRVDRHWSEKPLEEMTERDWRIFREDFNISYKGSKLPKPMRSWAESNLSSELLKAVERAGYKKPSPIQMASIPLGLQQRDVIGIAETGSGKTAAFVLPMLSYITRLPPISEDNEAEGPYAVVMAPTRELAQQIEDETIKFAHYLGIKVVSIVGGQSIEEQGFKIRQGCEVVIATPGRLLDCLERRYCVLNQCNYVVLDEADRMIDMGFEPQVVGVLDAMPSSNLKPENEDEELDEKRIYRTTYMFSATMPPAVERLARKYLRNPVVVNIGTAGKTTDLISQHVIMMKESEKMPRLQKLLDEMGDKTAIVFVNTKKSADSLAKSLDKAGYRVTTLHGGKSQDQREVSLDGFRTKRYNVLVATDVAGRGIDIPDVAHVINYDMPGNIEMYTHRIGRTGRAGKSGVATTFLTFHDTEVFYDLKQMLLQSNSPVPPELARHEASKFKPGTIPDRPPRRNDTVYAH
ncbi:Envelope glycoprotein gp160 [Dionaea muscipula]